MKIEDKYRTHPDSFVPGGTEVMIFYQDQEEPLIYDKVKSPSQYIEAALNNHPEIVEVFVKKGDDWILTWKA